MKLALYYVRNMQASVYKISVVVQSKRVLVKYFHMDKCKIPQRIFVYISCIICWLNFHYYPF